MHNAHWLVKAKRTPVLVHCVYVTSVGNRTDEAQRLVQARMARGIGDAKATAKYFGWNYNTYSQHERGERGLRKSVALKYALAFKVSPGWLMTGEGPDPGLNLSSEKASSKQALESKEPVATVAASSRTLYRNQLRDSDRILVGVGALKNRIIEVLADLDLSLDDADAYADCVLDALITNQDASAVIPITAEDRTDPELPVPAVGDLA